MALIVEDGTGLEDADSFVTLEEVRAFAQSRGATVSDDDTVLEPLVRSAHDYLLSVEGRFQGNRAVAGQSLPFPRCGVQLFGVDLETDVIPRCVKSAACQLVLETLDPMASSDGRVVLSETVGPISTTYGNPGVGGTAPILPRVDTFLTPVFSTGSFLSTRRV